MSKANNVNPDHYKIAGRERPGKDVVKGPKQPARAELPAKNRRKASWNPKKSER